MNDVIDDEACKVAAKALVVAVDRLHRAIAAASPERGQELLATLALAGATPVVTVRQLDVGRYAINAGLTDAETNKSLETFAMELHRLDCSPRALLGAIAAGEPMQ